MAYMDPTLFRMWDPTGLKTSGMGALHPGSASSADIFVPESVMPGFPMGSSLGLYVTPLTMTSPQAGQAMAPPDLSKEQYDWLMREIEAGKQVSPIANSLVNYYKSQVIQGKTTYSAPSSGSTSLTSIFGGVKKTPTATTTGGATSPSGVPLPSTSFSLSSFLPTWLGGKPAAKSPTSPYSGPTAPASSNMPLLLGLGGVAALIYFGGKGKGMKRLKNPGASIKRVMRKVGF